MVLIFILSSYPGSIRTPAFALSDKMVHMVDERFTSVMAQRAMIDGGLKKKQRQNKALVDTISATIILQSYLEQNSRL